MDPAKLEAAIRPGVTKAVVAVSFHGQCPRSEALAAICARHGIPLLEDGAQSFGATRNGLRSCGSVPGFLASTTSFYPAKPYGCYGDGGAVFTNDADLALRLKSIRAYGGLQRDNYEVVGTNARLDTIQAAVLLVKLKYYPDVLAARQQVARWYDEELAGCGGVLPGAVEGNTHTYAQYTVAVRNRAPIMQALKDAGIPHGVYYATPLHLQKCFADLGYARGAFPVSERLCDTVLSLPIHQYVTRDQVKAVAGALRDAIAAHGGALTLEELRTGYAVATPPASASSPSAAAASAPHHPPFFRTTDPLPTALPLPTLPDPMAPGAPAPFVHPTAVVDAGARLGAGTRVWHFGHVCGTASVGGYCNLGQNVYVANGVTIGNHCKIQNNVSVYEGVHIEDEVFLGACVDDVGSYCARGCI
jgi:hypothetical protein